MGNGIGHILTVILDKVIRMVNFKRQSRSDKQNREQNWRGVPETTIQLSHCVLTLLAWIMLTMYMLIALVICLYSLALLVDSLNFIMGW